MDGLTPFLLHRVVALIHILLALGYVMLWFVFLHVYRAIRRNNDAAATTAARAALRAWLVVLVIGAVPVLLVPAVYYLLRTH